VLVIRIKLGIVLRDATDIEFKPPSFLPSGQISLGWGEILREPPCPEDNSDLW
jgi:hypothetical protein